MLGKDCSVAICAVCGKWVAKVYYNNKTYVVGSYSYFHKAKTAADDFEIPEQDIVINYYI
jgi:hypothetical protein